MIRTMIGIFPPALKFALKTFWMILVFLAAGAVLSIVNECVNVLLIGQIIQPEAAMLFIRVIRFGVPALVYPVMYTFAFYVVKKQVSAQESGYGAFLSRHWFKFFLVWLCYMAANSLLGLVLRSGFVHFVLPLYILGLILKFMLVLAQFYAFAFVIGTKEDRKERIERARYSLSTFLLFALLLSVIARIFADVLGMIQTQFMVRDDSSMLNFLTLMMGPQETLASAAVGFVAQVVDLLIRYVAIVCVSIFFAGAGEKGIINAEVVRQNRVDKREQKRVTLLLVQYRDLFITKRQLEDSLAVKKLIKLKKSVSVGVEHVVDMLTEYKNGRIDERDVRDWVETVRDNDRYAYAREQYETIERVLDEIDALLAQGGTLTKEKAQNFIHALD